MNRNLLVGGVGVALLLAAGLLGRALPRNEEQIVGAGYQDRVSAYFLGSLSTSNTLTALFTGNRAVKLSKYMENIHLDILYEPVSGQSNRYAEILIEGSNDDGVTWFPISSKVVGTNEISLYVTSTNGYGGIPIVIPGDKISVGSTTYRGSIDFDIVAERVRVSARESGTANYGDIKVYSVMSSKI